MENTVVLFMPHKENNPRNSEGAFVTLKDGRIMFAYTRYNSGDNWNDEAPANICALYSLDGGRSWVDESVLVDNEDDCNSRSVSLLRLHDGDIGLWYLRKNSVNDCRLEMRVSSDEGSSWI